MTQLDTAHAVHVQFPTKQEIVITTSTLPGLEFHIPPNTVITDIEGKIANQISITPIPLNQPPFPLPQVQLPIYFTIQPGGGYIQVSTSGNLWNNSTLQCTNAPGPFYGAVFSNNNGWTITLRDGTKLVFLQPGNFGPGKYQDIGLVSITDRNGNVLKVLLDSNNYITGIASPNGWWIQFTNDSNHRISVAPDNIGRTVQYFYDSLGRLCKVIDANGGIWMYGYDPIKIDRMTSLTDPRNIQLLQNTYDTNGRVTKQVLADQTSTYQFSYAIDSNNNIIQTTVTDPSGVIRRLQFLPPPLYPDGSFVSVGRYGSSQILALGRPQQQTISYQLYSGSNLLQSITDSLNRTTSFTYDVLGNLSGVTALSGTSSAVLGPICVRSRF